MIGRVSDQVCRLRDGRRLGFIEYGDCRLPRAELPWRLGVPTRRRRRRRCRPRGRDPADLGRPSRNRTVRSATGPHRGGLGRRRRGVGQAPRCRAVRGIGLVDGRPIRRCGGIRAAVTGEPGCDHRGRAAARTNLACSVSCLGLIGSTRGCRSAHRGWPGSASAPCRGPQARLPRFMAASPRVNSAPPTGR